MQSSHSRILPRLFIRSNTIRHFSSKINLQYISDLHIDSHKNTPKIRPISRYLAICGDIGQPYASNYKDFISEQANNFEKVFIVPGNHDFDLGPMYHKERVVKWEPFVKNICHGLKNVYYLNCDTHNLTDDILIAGSILWSKPIPRNDTIYSDYDPRVSRYLEHIIEHNKHINWIRNVVSSNKNKKIIMLTHFVPSFKLIEDKYKAKGNYTTSWFATDLEYLITSPIKAWICGHTHSVIECNINGVKCAINAYGYGVENRYIENKYIDKIIEID